MKVKFSLSISTHQAKIYKRVTKSKDDTLLIDKVQRMMPIPKMNSGVIIKDCKLRVLNMECLSRLDSEYQVS